MPRATNSPASKKRKKRVLKQAKGFWGRRSNCYTIATEAVDKKYLYSYRDRRVRARDFRSLWILRINAGARLLGTKYSHLIRRLKEEGILLNRKVLADLAMNYPTTFASVVNQIKPLAPIQP